MTRRGLLMFRLNGRAFTPAKPALPPSLEVVFCGVIPSGHKWMTRSDYVQDERYFAASWMTRSDYVPVKDLASRLPEHFCEDLGVLLTA